ADLGYRHETTIHDLTVEHDGASAALALTAAFFRAGELELFAQNVEQARHWEDVERARRTINFAFDKHCLNRSNRSYTTYFPAIIFSGMSGMLLKLTPVAFSIAFKIAGAAPSIGNSPMPLAPPGPYAYGFSSK